MKYYINYIIKNLHCIFLLGYTAAGILVSLFRYWQFETFYYDFGIYDQAIWRVSRFQPPIIDHFVRTGQWIFADHFTPSLFLLSPLYWITSRAEIQLIAQVVAVSLSGWVLYKIGISVLKDRFISFAIMVSYLLFVGLQNALITDIHPDVFATLPFMLTVYSFVRNKKRSYYLWLLIFLGFKENFFLVSAGLAIFIWFVNKKWRKISLITLVISLLWGWLSIKIIIPYFAGDLYQYAPTDLGSMLRDLTFLIDHPIKRKTLFDSLLSFGFLPLLFPPAYPLILQDLSVRFFPQFSYLRWGMSMHYSVQLAGIMGVSSIYACLRFGKKARLYYGIVLVIVALFMHQFYLHGPLALAYNRAFYPHTKNLHFLEELVNKVPKDASVMTQNNLAVRFTHQDVMLLRDNYEVYNPDYIVLDLRDEQNPNVFFGLKDKDSLLTFLLRDKNYEAIFQTEYQYVFQKK